MTPEENAAYVMSQASCALIEAFGMMSDNLHRRSLDQTIAYDGKAFNALIDQYGISHNAVLRQLGQ